MQKNLHFSPCSEQFWNSSRFQTKKCIIGGSLDLNEIKVFFPVLPTLLYSTPFPYLANYYYPIFFDLVEVYTRTHDSAKKNYRRGTEKKLIQFRKFCLKAKLLKPDKAAVKNVVKREHLWKIRQVQARKTSQCFASISSLDPIIKVPK